ncbi:MAG: DNA-directed RNA polymerase subunit alpha [Phycisphaerae bacterium]|nr:DNA-directed RNA polymerase subunit alpha [Phycisphaerae bacterium]
MRIRWRGLELPARVIKDDAASTAKYGRFSIEPFERGFGATIGNSLRRILLSSLEGAAISRVRIAGADHEFCSLEGVLEDVTDIILNIKSLIVSIDGSGPKTMRLERKGAGPVKGGDFQCEAGLEVRNPEQHIATLTGDVKFAVELTADVGRGYIPASELVDDDTELGIIAVDALYSPVVRVRYRTEETRVGQKTNYDRLILEVWTKGTVTPDDALVEAAKILRKHLNPFVQYYELGSDIAATDTQRAQAVLATIDPALMTKLRMPVRELELSVRALNCLDAANIFTVNDLVRKDDIELMELRSFGKTSLDEVRQKLETIGLTLGMRHLPELGAAATDENAN